MKSEENTITPPTFSGPRKLPWKIGAALFVALGCIAAVLVSCLLLSSFLPRPLNLFLSIIFIFLGSLVGGLAGFAFSAVTGAFLFHWLTPSVAVPLLIACSITIQTIGIASMWDAIQWQEVLPFLFGGLPGIPIGTYLLQNLKPHQFAVGFGSLLIAYSSYMLWHPRFALRDNTRWWGAAAIGFVGGITGSMAAFPSALLTVWCTLRTVSKDSQRSLVQPFILFMQLATLGYFVQSGVIATTTLAIFLCCTPAVIGGTFAGLWLYRRIDDAMFRCLVLMLLLISGVALIF